jgi:hypothetical protein
MATLRHEIRDQSKNIIAIIELDAPNYSYLANEQEFIIHGDYYMHINYLGSDLLIQSNHVIPEINGYSYSYIVNCVQIGRILVNIDYIKYICCKHL